MKNIVKRIGLSLAVLAFFMMLLPGRLVYSKPVLKSESPTKYETRQLLKDAESKERDLIQKSKANIVSAAAIPSYQIAISQSTATKNNWVDFTLTFTTYQNYDGANIILTNSASGTEYLVELQRVSGTLFEGSIYISNFTEPGEYAPTLLAVMAGDTFDSINLNMGTILTVEGTVGDHYPVLGIEFDKAEYQAGETVKVTVTPAESGLEEFSSCDMYFSEDYEFNQEPFVLLNRMPDGTYYGEYPLSNYFPEGTISIDSLAFSNVNGGEEWYYSSAYYAEGTTTNYQQLDSTFSVVNSLVDTDAPQFQEITVSGYSITANGSVTFTVRASDATSGVKNVAIGLGDIEIELKKAGDETWTGEYQSDPFTPEFSPIEVLYVSLVDYAGNYYFAEPDTDFGPISITLDRNPLVGEISGSDRYETAIQVSRYFPESDRIILAKGTDFPDALAAGPLSYALKAPILLCKTDGISDSTLNEIKNRGAKEVIIMGGEMAISENVVSTLQANGVQTVRRIAGDNRYATAIEAAKELGTQMGAGGIDRVVITYGMNFPDALSSGSWASLNNLPILLNTADTLRTEVKSYLLENNIKDVTLIGGSSVLSDNLMQELKNLGLSVSRISGPDRYSTSVAVASKYFSSSTLAIVTNGLDYPDALTAVPLAAFHSAPLLLAKPLALPDSIDTYLSDPTLSEIGMITVIGGDSAVSDGVKLQINNILMSKLDSGQ